jgi:catechol 2,3-dioxygenase
MGVTWLVKSEGARNGKPGLGTGMPGVSAIRSEHRMPSPEWRGQQKQQDETRGVVMKKGVMRPGHIQLRVLNLESALVHYRDLLGLIEVDRDDYGRVYLKAWAEVDKFSLVLREADEPGMDFMGFKVLDEDCLNRLTEDLLNYGCLIENIPAGELRGCGRRVGFQAPSGHSFELYADKEYTG